MRAENQLQWMMDLYPSLFPTRRHCLNYLFCVVGNGFQWVNGELVDLSDPMSLRYRMIETVEHAKGLHEDDWYRNSLVEVLRTISRTDDFDPSVKLRRHNFKWVIPDPKYSHLYDAPADICQDWAVLIAECRQLMQEDGVVLDG